jgi:hypothetical protein
MIVSTVTVAAVGIIGGGDRVGSPTVVPHAGSCSSLIKGNNDRLTENPLDKEQISPMGSMEDFDWQDYQ